MAATDLPPPSPRVSSPPPLTALRNLFRLFPRPDLITFSAKTNFLENLVPNVFSDTFEDQDISYVDIYFVTNNNMIISKDLLFTEKTKKL